MTDAPRDEALTERILAAHALASEIEQVSAGREAGALRRGRFKISARDCYDPHTATELAALILKRMP